MSQKPSQLQAWTVKVHWGGEAVLSQHQTGAFIPAVYRHRGAAYARMKLVTPTFQTHSGMPYRPSLPDTPSSSGAFLHSLLLGGSCSVTMETSRPPPHYCTSPQCSDLLPKDSAPHLNIPRGSNPSAVPWESFSKRELMNEG